MFFNFASRISAVLRKLCVLCLCFIGMHGQLAYADVNVLQSISFGELIITDNAAAHSITINSDGSYTASNSMIVIQPPQRGVYEIDDLPPNTLINVTASQLSPLSGAGNFFTMKDFQILHSNTDFSGLTSITLGATAETSGNNNVYQDRTYNGQIQIQISF